MFASGRPVWIVWLVVQADVFGLNSNDTAGEGPREAYRGRRILAIAGRFGKEIDTDMHLTYEDVIDTVGKVFLG